jgi:hypothetical protein
MWLACAAEDSSKPRRTASCAGAQMSRGAARPTPSTRTKYSVGVPRMSRNILVRDPIVSAATSDEQREREDPGQDDLGHAVMA